MMPKPLCSIRLFILCSFILFHHTIFATEAELNINSLLAPLQENHPDKTGIYVLEKGEESLLARAWLTDHSSATIDIQYFIWSSDNIGILASESLVRAAERGVTIRVLVDDLLIKASDESLLALATHPNIHIRIYNPAHSVGVSKFQRLLNVIKDFRSVNQRLHNKIALFDDQVAITGGRNMADEYYDYDHEYNFRDRDVLLAGTDVKTVREVFDLYWQHKLAVPIEQLLEEELTDLDAKEIKQLREKLHEYASNPENYAPEVRNVLQDMTTKITDMLKLLHWDNVEFISDQPGKNITTRGLGGGGITTDILLHEILQAEDSITIQSPYLVLPPGSLEVFTELVKKGVDVRIITNSLASTDNLMAFSGYAKQKQDILSAGIKVFEYKPYPAIARTLLLRHDKLGKNIPVFAIHAKTMVIDNKTLFIGTFNLDPRSANLNTEVGVIIRNQILADSVEQQILNDMHVDNSWPATDDNANAEASLGKRIKLFFYRLLPLEPVL